MPLAPNSGVLVLPNTTSPASRNRCVTSACRSATSSARAREPFDVGNPAYSWPRSLTRNGTPANGPSSADRGAGVGDLGHRQHDRVERRVDLVDALARQGQQLDRGHLPLRDLLGQGGGVTGEVLVEIHDGSVAIGKVHLPESLESGVFVPLPSVRGLGPARLVGPGGAETGWKTREVVRPAATIQEVEDLLRYDARTALARARDELDVAGMDPNTPLYQRWLLAKGAAQASIGDTEDGARIMREVKNWAEEHDDDALLASSHRRLSALFRRIGDPALMLEHAVTAVDLLARRRRPTPCAPTTSSGSPTPSGPAAPTTTRSAATTRPPSSPTAAATAGCSSPCSTTSPTRSTKPAWPPRPSRPPSGSRRSSPPTASSCARTTATRSPAPTAWSAGSPRRPP